MPIIKSAIKRAKQSLVRRSRNLQVKRAIKQDVGALHTAIEAGDSAEVQAKLAAAYSEIDRAVRKHTLHKNTAARRKSQLAGAVAKSVAARLPRSRRRKPRSRPPKPAAKPAAKKAPAKKAPAKKADAK